MSYCFDYEELQEFLYELHIDQVNEEFALAFEEDKNH